MLNRLSGAVLHNDTLRKFQTSDYSRDLPCRVVHIGVGAFHRAHQALYFDQMNEILASTGEDPWMIQGVSLRTDTALHQLNPQDGLFLHVARGHQGSSERIVRSIKSVIHAGRDPEALIELIAAADTQLVTLTITEKGYGLEVGSNELNTLDAAVSADLDSLLEPQTAIGFLAAGLRRRRAMEHGPLTILSCDNLSNNGRQCRHAVLSLARHHDPALAAWIEEAVSFPCSMVDRIAPAVTTEDLTWVESHLSVQDQAVAITERFSQWVIEDNFKGEKPPLDRVGVEYSKDVTEWEHRKLRLLNAAHSAMAYMGGLLEFEYVHEAVDDAVIASLVRDIWQEARTTLDDADSSVLDGYCQSLIARFKNPHLNHRLFQIAMDGSQKLPQRVLAPLRERLVRGQASPALTQVVAAWLVWQWGRTLSGKTFEVQDPWAHQLGQLIEESQTADRAFDALVTAFEPIADLLTAHPSWREELYHQFKRLLDRAEP